MGTPLSVLSQAETGLTLKAAHAERSKFPVDFDNCDNENNHGLYKLPFKDVGFKRIELGCDIRDCGLDLSPEIGDYSHSALQRRYAAIRDAKPQIFQWSKAITTLRITVV